MRAELHIPQPEFHHPAELAMIARLGEHPEVLVREYLAMHQKNGQTFISRDAAKKLFPEYNSNPTDCNRYSDASASSLAEGVRRQLLSKAPNGARNEMVLVTGTPASGKSVSSATITGPTIEIVHESILTSLPKAALRVKGAVAAGRIPQIVVVYTNDPRINVRRMIDRARRIGRTVPIKYMAATYVGVPQIVAQLHQEFAASLRMTLMNNSGSVRDVILDYEVHQMFADLGDYTVESCLRVMDDELSQIDEKDPIPAGILREARRSDELS